ncbi:MAG: competence protein CoiA family protein [Myxococcota bacterium]
MSAGVQLSWVMWEGRACHVSTFAGLAPSQRPAVYCPACQGPVVLRLGEQVAHHAAHRVGQDCAATAPESALHLNCKLYLAEQLSGRARLSIRMPCAAGLSGCQGTVQGVWRSGWDTVAVEMGFGARRPDLSLMRGDRPLAALEVRVHSAVTDQKRADLAALRLPWIETRGSPQLLTWTADDPLPIDAWSGPPLYCAICRPQVHQLARMTADTTERWRQTLRRYAQARHDHAAALARFTASTRDLRDRTRTDGVQVVQLRPFDRYAPHVKQVHRAALFVAVRRRDGRIRALTLGITDPLQTLARSALSDHTGHQQLLRIADAHLDRLRETWIIDAPDGWLSLDALLDDPAFMEGWAKSGAAHRWTTMIPELTTGRGPTATGFDLMAYVLARYLSGLPRRYTWQPSTGWCATVPAPAWRLWRPELSGV